MDRHDSSICGVELKESVSMMAMARWRMNSEDLNWENELGNPSCSVCLGFGIVDDGNPFAFIPDNCQCVIDKIAESYYCHGFGI